MTPTVAAGSFWHGQQIDWRIGIGRLVVLGLRRGLVAITVGCIGRGIIAGVRLFVDGKARIGGAHDGEIGLIDQPFQRATAGLEAVGSAGSEAR